MNSREKLVQATADLLWERGYGAMSPTAIQQRAGVGQGSMYHHFTGKADLAAAGMARMAQQLRTDARRVLSGPGTAADRIHTYLDLPREPLRGCQLGRLVQDDGVLTEPSMHDITADFFRWLCEQVTAVLLEGQQAGQIRPDVPAGDLAALVVAAVQGGYVLARSIGVDAYRSVIRGAHAAVAQAAVAAQADANETTEALP